MKNNNEEQIHKVMSSLKVKNSNEQIKEKKKTIGDKFATLITVASGSWWFILFLGILIFGWMFLQHCLGQKAYDQYPYILLNLCISVICVLQNPFILMSQNLQNKADSARAEADYETNKKNEVYLEHLHEKSDAQSQEIAELKQLINNISDKLDNQK